ncbi:unnamed protein product [Phaeothamnion confervicola]
MAAPPSRRAPISAAPASSRTRASVSTGATNALTTFPQLQQLVKEVILQLPEKALSQTKTARRRTMTLLGQRSSGPTRPPSAARATQWTPNVSTVLRNLQAQPAPATLLTFQGGQQPLQLPPNMVR